MLQSTHNEFQLPLPLDSGVQPPPKARGWRYLVANTIGFSKGVEHGIWLRKPAPSQLCSWLSKLVMSGQCEVIYVENMRLTANEHQRLSELSALHGVNLVNLTIEPDAPGNIVVGPW